MVRPLLLTVLAAAGAFATPVDAVRDFLSALERADGYSMVDIFSASLRLQCQSGLDQLSALCESDPDAARMALAPILPSVAPGDIPGMDLGGFISLLLLRVDPSPWQPSSIEREQADMTGRSAAVTITWMSGRSETFNLVWEEGSWRINGSSMLEAIFVRVR
jgi:hypothetical protein